MRVQPGLTNALAALAYTLGGPAPRGGAVRVAARAVGRAARAARYTPDGARGLLALGVLPVLRVQHPGPAGDWLWDRVLASVFAAYAAAGDAPAAAAAGPPVVYRVDGDDVITRVNAAWAGAAADGGAPALATAALGTCLWDHVRGARTRRLYTQVHAAVRRTGRPFVLPYRCDAPDARRWMRLTIAPAGRGHLEVTSALVESTPRPPLALFDPAAPRDGRWVHACSVCQRVRGDGPAARGAEAASPARRVVWLDADRAAAPAAVPPAVPRLHHGLCPDCEADLRAALARASA